MSSSTPVTSANASPVTTRISQSSDGQSIIEPPNMTPTEPNTTPEDINSTEQMMSKNMIISNTNHVMKYTVKQFVQLFCHVQFLFEISRQLRVQNTKLAMMDA